MIASHQDLPIDGVALKRLLPHTDERGTFIEIYRESWSLGCLQIQSNVVTSKADVLRGVHVHVRHADHLVVVAGAMILGLHDLRPWSRTAGASTMVSLAADEPQAVAIPVGVAHGFFFPQPSTHVYGVSEYWNLQDELSCRWDAPELALSWPVERPMLSQRDAAAGDYEAFRQAFLTSWRDAYGSLPSKAA